MNNGKTLFCALSASSKWVRAVVLENGKFRNRFRTPAQRDDTLEELSRFFDFQFIDEDSAPTKIVLVGSPEGAHLSIMQELIDDCPELFRAEFPHGPDIQRILARDERTIQEEYAFRRLDLLAHLCFLQHNRISLTFPPDTLLLEWALDRAQKQHQYLEEEVQSQREDIPF